MMATMNPKLMISSAHPPAPVKAWAGIAGARVDSETAIGQHTAHSRACDHSVVGEYCE